MELNTIDKEKKCCEVVDRKERKEKQKQREDLFSIFGTVYSIFIISLCIAITVYFSLTRVKVDSSVFFEAFYIILYMSGCAILVFLLIFICKSPQICPKIDGSIENVKNNQLSKRHRLTAEGFNVYLLLGLAVFLLGSVIYNCLRIAGEFSHMEKCFNASKVVFCFCQMSYIILQSIFVFLYHKIVFVKYTSLTRFFLIHLFSVNMCTWAHSAIGEIVEGVAAEEQKRILSKTNSTETIHSDECLIDSLTDSVRPFLIPMIIEYALLTGPMMLEIMLRTVHLKSEHCHHKKDEEKEFPRLHKSKRGFIFAALVSALSIAAIIIFYLVHNFFAGAFVYHVIDISLNLIGLFLSFLCIFQLRKFRYVKCEKGSFDDTILILCLFGAFIYCVVSIVSGVDILRSSKTAYNAYILAGLKLTAQLITTLQCGLQTVMLLDGSRRRAAGGHHVTTKPARPYLVTLLGINLALWLFDAFEVIKVDVHYTSEYLDFDGSLDSLTWTILLHTTLPLMIFFRFHSTAMLSIIWHKAYEKNE